MVKKKKSGWSKKVLIFVIKSPYYLSKWIYNLSKKMRKKIAEEKIDRKRESIKAIYSDMGILDSIKGNYSKFENEVFNSESKIGVILGARGSGKTAFAIRFIENLYFKTKKRIYAIGFDEDEMPSFINVIDDISKIKNDSFVLIDEGGILFNSRSSMSNANKLLSRLILIARHKNLNILFISQNSSNLDVNILRQADFLVLKPSSLLQKDFERKIVQKIYDSVEGYFEKYQNEKGLAYIYSGKFRGFISNSLPSFWKISISKSFSGG